MTKRKSPGVALITGSAKRIGQGIALYLADQGYDIALHYHTSKAQAMATAQKIYKTKVRCELFPCDLADEQQAKALLPQVYRAMPQLSLLVNSASLFIPNRLGDEDLTLFKAHWDINFKAPYLLTCAFVRLAKKGQVINLIDTQVAKNKTAYADYLLSKKALADFTKMAAVQFGPHVRVNGISPGMILPPVNKRADDRIQRAKSIPLQKVGDIQCILETINFLLNNNYVTGQIITNDGGECLI